MSIPCSKDILLTANNRTESYVVGDYHKIIILFFVCVSQFDNQKYLNYLFSFVICEVFLEVYRQQ